MRYLKILVLAAAALTAFAGADTASATELCAAEESPCREANMYKAGTLIHAESDGHVIFKITPAKVECSSTLEAETTNTGGLTETVKGTITALSFTCTPPCTATVLKKGSLEVHTTETNVNFDGTLTGLNTEFTITCSNVSCIFGTSASGTDLGWITATPPAGGSMATVDIKANILWKAGDSSNSICTLGTGAGKWEGSYTVTKPEPFVVV